MTAPAHISLQSIAAVNERCVAFLMKRSRKQKHIDGCYRGAYKRSHEVPDPSTCNPPDQLRNGKTETEGSA